MFNVKALSSGPKHHFYGYYDINPWDPSFRYHLALETDFHERRPEARDVAAVGLVDRETQDFIPRATTSAFNLQQGSMLHWIEAGFGAEFTFNDWEYRKVISRSVGMETGEMRTIQGGIAGISPTEPVAIGLNYARMAHCRAVVGYANDMDPATLEDHPEDDGLFLLDLKSGESKLILSIAEVVRTSRYEGLNGKRAWFNHVLFNTDGTRIMFFCRFRYIEEPRIQGTSLWTVNPDGSNLKCQIPFGGHISHFDWRDEKHLLMSSDVLGKFEFVEFTDNQNDFKPFGNGALRGHACFSPDRRWIVFDNRIRKGDKGFATLTLYNVESSSQVSLGEFYHDEKFKNDIRCDLHPRWSPDGKIITFDSVHEGSRQIYIVNVSDIVG